MSLVRNEVTTPDLRPMGAGGTHSLGNRFDRKSLQPGENIAPEIDAIERAVVTPLRNRAPLLHRRLRSPLLRLGRVRRVVARFSHGRDLGWASRFER